MKGILNEPSEEEEDYPSPSSGRSLGLSNHQEFIFGYSSQMVETLTLHPSPEHIPVYWLLYKENVDPLVKVLHVPTFQATVLEARDRLHKIPKALDAMLFSIYYAAITSLTLEECKSRFGQEKKELLKKYRFAVEQALARANFMTTEELLVLQALVVFLMCLRRNDDARVIWTLTGLVVRVAQTLGLHRDGSNFNLKPFDTEMRRRVWWNVCLLDVRASEDHGCDPTITEHMFDTRIPLNIYDADLDPLMTEPPKERLGGTDMIFCLIRAEMSTVFRKINFVPRNSNLDTTMTLVQKEELIAACHQRIEERYLKQIDMSVPLYWVVAHVARLMLSKMWVMCYHPIQRTDGVASLPQETRDKLFTTSLETLEYHTLLENEVRFAKWNWLFKTYIQWHALAFLLTELTFRTKGDLVERAWRVINAIFAKWSESTSQSNKVGLWKPLRKLMSTARSVREQALAQEELAGKSGQPYSLNPMMPRIPKSRYMLNPKIYHIPHQPPQSLPSPGIKALHVPYTGPDPAAFNRGTAPVNGAASAPPGRLSVTERECFSQSPAYLQSISGPPSNSVTPQARSRRQSSQSSQNFSVNPQTFTKTSSYCPHMATNFSLSHCHLTSPTGPLLNHQSSPVKDLGPHRSSLQTWGDTNPGWTGPV